jgi:predicted MFS family arabinose efflux permease
MLGVLANRTYRHLFLAQVVSLVGTGLATVALGLLAFDLAGDRAGVVLGTALVIKMIAYVGVAPVAAAFAERLPRRAMLVALDLVRALVALALPFVTEVWQVYLLVFLLQSASAGFTPTFQATIPDVLTDERDYTNALSLSRLAYDLESLISPMLAAALLTVISFHNLFAGTVFGFLLSAALVITVRLPSPKPTAPRGVSDRTTRGIRLYLATPRLRGLLALNFAVAAAGAMVIVNTVVLVKSGFGLGDPEVALALAAFGAGSMVAALALPRLLERVPDRKAMLTRAGILTIGMLIGPLAGSLASLMPLWLVLGLGYSLTQTPTGRLLRRSAHAEDRPALFAAQFALSHACWLITYPLAGRLGAAAGLPATFLTLAALALLAVLAARQVWPTPDPEALDHTHPDLAPDDPHFGDTPYDARGHHAHAFVIDDRHPAWPRPA